MDFGIIQRFASCAHKGLLREISTWRVGIVLSRRFFMSTPRHCTRPCPMYRHSRLEQEKMAAIKEAEDEAEEEAPTAAAASKMPQRRLHLQK